MSKSVAGNSLERWHRQTESGSMAIPAAALEDAKRCFDSLPLESQVELTLEVAESRRADITSTFDNVVSLTAGMRRKTGRGKWPRLTIEPTVIFLVRRKWKKRSPSGSTRKQFLPQHLLTHITSDGFRRLCAVPTDVQLAFSLARGRTQHAGGVAVTGPNGNTDGCLTCCTRIGGQLFVLAPIHVLTPTPIFGVALTEAGSVLAIQPNGAADGPQLASSTRFGGRLVQAPEISFDAQFATITKIEALRGAFINLVFSPTRPSVKNFGEIAVLSANGGLFALAPDNHRGFPGRPRKGLIAGYAGVVPPQASLKYRVLVGGTEQEDDVCHQALMEMQFASNKVTTEGDSGCPVVAMIQDGMTFVGMHIAGNEDKRLSFVIPAWQLLSRLSYDSLPDGDIALATP